MKLGERVIALECLIKKLHERYETYGAIGKATKLFQDVQKELNR